MFQCKFLSQHKFHLKTFCDLCLLQWHCVENRVSVFISCSHNSPSFTLHLGRAKSDADESGNYSGSPPASSTAVTLPATQAPVRMGDVTHVTMTSGKWVLISDSQCSLAVWKSANLLHILNEKREENIKAEKMQYEIVSSQ